MESSVELHNAVLYHDEERVKQLLLCGADVNIQDASINTPLHYVCRYPQMGMLHILLSAYPDLSILNKYGMTALTCACFSRDYNCISALLKAGADIDENTRNMMIDLPLEHQIKFWNIYRWQKRKRLVWMRTPSD